MSLTEQLQALYQASRGKRPAEVLAIMDDAAKRLAESGQADRAVNVGVQAPRFALPNVAGETVSADDLLAGGPVVLSFYRGAWCPYCNLELRALQEHVDEFAALGARLVAISPQIPDETLSVTQKDQLTFDVLSDLGSEVAGRYGLAFDLPDELTALYDQWGFDLARVNGGYGRTLPLPATYVLDREGVIQWAFVNSDYTQRAEPAEILKALTDLR